MVHEHPVNAVLDRMEVAHGVSVDLAGDVGVPRLRVLVIPEMRGLIGVLQLVTLDTVLPL